MPLLTKQQILDEFAILSVDKLNRLYAYSKYLIIPDEELLTNVTMQQMVEKANELADEFFPEWTDRSPTDFGSFLVETIGIFSEKDFWYINAFANQSLLTKMTVYSSAFIRSVELGYRPIVFTASQATYSLDFVPGASTIYLTGDLVVQAADGTKFTNASSFFVPFNVGVVTFATTLRQGEYAVESLVYNGRSIDIRKEGIDTTTIEVSINGLSWQQVPVFGQSGSSSTHYMVLPEEDGKCSIWFGDGTFGKQPDVSDKVDVKYLFCKGADGNVPLQTSSVSKSVTSRKCQTATMTTVSINGVDGSSLSELKNLTLNYSNYREACLNEVSTRAWLLDRPGIAKANVSVSGSTVYYYWYSKLGAAPTLLEQSDIQALLDPLVSNGFLALYTATVFQTCGPLAATFYYLDGFDAAELESLGKQIIQDHTDPLVTNDYGKGFLQSEVVLSLVSRLEGLSNVVFTSISGGPPVDVVSSFNMLLTKVALGNITITMVKV